MYLKEAFHYQNHLAELLNMTIRLLSDNKNVLHVVQNHCRTKACQDANDEIIDLSSERNIPYEANDLIDFMTHLVGEKEQLTSAISAAKAGCDIDIDAEIANNKMRQVSARAMARMNALRATERTFRASDYKFNAEGNQTPYSYEVREVSSIDFDRNKVKSVQKALANKCDEVSTAIDRAMINVVVDFNPKYDVIGTFDDAMETYLASREPKQM